MTDDLMRYDLMVEQALRTVVREVLGASLRMACPVSTIFTLLSSIFFPLITTGADAAYSVVIGGTATLFVGLAGGILLFKATTSIKRRGVFLVVGFALIGISLALIFLVQEWWKLEFMRS